MATSKDTSKDKSATAEETDVQQGVPDSPPVGSTANPYNSHTQPQAYATWEADRQFAESEGERRDFASARLEDAGLHPQAGANMPAATVGGIGDSQSSKPEPQKKVAKNEHGETPAEEYRRQLAARDADSDEAPEQFTEAQITPQVSAASTGISQPTQTDLTREQAGSGAPG